MNDFLGSFLLELALLSFLGALYYFYQKRKILHYEDNKTSLVMGFILESCLAEKKEIPEQELDLLIESLDDYLKDPTINPPIALLSQFMTSPNCSAELSDIIRHGLIEIDADDNKK